MAVAFRPSVKKAKADAPQDDLASAMQEVRPERKPQRNRDLPHACRGPALGTGCFQRAADLDIAPGDEWHWAMSSRKRISATGVGDRCGNGTRDWADGDACGARREGREDDAAAPASQPQ